MILYQKRIVQVQRKKAVKHKKACTSKAETIINL